MGRNTKNMLSANILILVTGVNGFLSSSFARLPQSYSTDVFSSAHRSSSSSSSFDALQRRIDVQRKNELISALFGKTLSDLQLVGQTSLKTIDDSLQDCAVLRSSSEDEENSTAPSTPSCLLVPLTPSQLKLLQYAEWNQPQSKFTLLASLSPLLINRDNALFDNLPWVAWTKDPQKRNRDAAGNLLSAKFSLGKRDAYNRFLGKDWNGKTTKAAVMQWMDRLEERNVMEESASKRIGDEDSIVPSELSQRILEIQFREAQMDLAEIESDLAIATQQGMETRELVNRQETAQKVLDDMQQQAQSLQPNCRKSSPPSLVQQSSQNNPPPYRGATGFDPQTNTVEDQTKDYASPFHLMKEILQDQLQAEVVGAVLENSSILQTVVGGAIVLRRIPKKDSMTIAGEKLEAEDPSYDFGNPSITGGSSIIVECDADEAIGLSLACAVPLKVESDLMERASVKCSPIEEEVIGSMQQSYKTVLRSWQVIDSELSLLSEGQFANQSKTERVLVNRSPQSTLLFDVIFEPRPVSSPVFPTDNPIQSLDEYDALTTRDKAYTLQTMSNFNGRLPRPRAVRDQPTLLDGMLLPLVDESVRRQYLIRDARQRGDMETVKDLESTKSRRQVAKERATQARDYGQDDTAEYWESEANFLTSLRADSTQDEGSYSQWLDRDEWYERQRAKMVERIDKNKFGTLLDGIDI